MRQAITTTYKGPTDHRGARIIARADAGSITVPYDHALNAPENHTAAAEALAQKLKWDGVWCGGGVKAGYVFVLVPESLAELREVKPGEDLFRISREPGRPILFKRD